MIAYLVIQHPAEYWIMAKENADNLSLPIFDISGWVAYAVSAINAHVKQTYGLSTTVLRHVHESSFHVVLLETHQGIDFPQESVNWFPIGEVAKRCGDQDLKDVLEVLRVGSPMNPQIPWEQVGWFKDASEWIGEVVQTLGRHQTGPIEQYKAAWGWSTILRVPTSESLMYFKAGYSTPPSEGDVIELLAHKFPNRVPQVLAYERSQNWILTDDFGEVLSSQLHLEHLTNAVQIHAEIQISESSDLSTWQQIGTPFINTETLRTHAATLLVEAESLSQYCLNELSRCSDILDQAFDSMDQSTIPNSIVNQDFRPGNVALTPSSELVFFDWGNVVVAHPFFGFLMFYRYCTNNSTDFSSSLCTEYLKPWLPYSSEKQLYQNLKTAKLLEPVFVSLWEHREIEMLDSTSPWCRHLSKGILTRRGGQSVTPIGQIIQAAENIESFIA